MGISNTNEKGEKTFKYSEIFHSFQGEGAMTGRSTAWIRFFACNLSCSGFGQEDPTDPSTYILPYKDIDLSNITEIEQLPVFEFGCDSGYTWSARYKHLMKSGTPKEIVEQICLALASDSNPLGLFKHPLTRQQHHMAFTGGEPMLNQEAMVKILDEMYTQCNFPYNVTVETNGTKPFNKKAGLDSFIPNYYGRESHKGEWFWSVSPKLWTTAGEKPKKAIRPEVVGSYAEVSDAGQLKYVVNGTSESWDEVERNTEMYRDAGVNWQVYIMPVGATKEQQEDEQIAEICVDAMKRGYHVSGRLHTYIFGNAIGT